MSANPRSEPSSSPNDSLVTSSHARSLFGAALAYLFSPQVLLGGIIAFVLTQSVDFYKKHLSDAHEEFVSARDAVIKDITPYPADPGETTKVIGTVSALSTLYASKEARDLIDVAVKELTNARVLQFAAARKQLEADAAQALAAEALARTLAAQQIQASLTNAGEVTRLAAEAKTNTEAAAAIKAQANAKEQVLAAQVLRATQQDPIKNLVRHLGIKF